LAQAKIVKLFGRKNKRSGAWLKWPNKSEALSSHQYYQKKAGYDGAFLWSQLLGRGRNEDHYSRPAWTKLV
jgi:hypothetical protein